MNEGAREEGLDGLDGWMDGWLNESVRKREKARVRRLMEIEKRESEPRSKKGWIESKSERACLKNARLMNQVGNEWIESCS